MTSFLLSALRGEAPQAITDEGNITFNRLFDYLDHQMINELKPFDVINPSAENLAKYFYDETNKQLRDMTSGRVTVKDVLLYETDLTTARYYE